MPLRSFLVAGALIGFVPLHAADTKKPTPEPRLSSLYPFSLPAAKTSAAVIRGLAVDEPKSIQISSASITATVKSVRKEASDSPQTVLLEIDISVAKGTEPGEYSLRLVTAKGLTNQIAFRVVSTEVRLEEESSDSFRAFPATVSGRLSGRGENDSYWIEVGEGETLTFEAVSGHAAFDPSIGIYEPSGSWFDSKRLNRIAFNDEPLHFPGLSSNPRLIHTFTKAGRYCVKIGAFSGQGGADYVYELRMTRGAIPGSQLHPKDKPAWDERQFIRSVAGDWMQKVQARSGTKGELPAPELFNAVSENAENIPVMSIPGIVRGRLTKASEVHMIRLRIDKPQDVAFDIETPEANMPRFNPIVRVLEPGGAEIVTNVHTKLNNNGLYMMKMIQAKMTLSFRNPGEFIVQIRDITTDCAGDDFAYRILVRQQIPHVGRVMVAEDALSITAGTSKPLNLSIEREEDFIAPITFAVEGLPEGLSVATAISNIEEKPALFNGGKMERYTPKTQKTVLLVTAASGTSPMTSPVKVRIVAKPFVNGSLGDPISIKEISLIVLPGSSS